MDCQAYRRYIKGVGYVVIWFENYQSYPLRNFGYYQSAAIEFAKMVNDYAKDDKERRIKGLIESYDPTVSYSYPEPTTVGIAKLTKQKDYETD